MQRRWRTLVWAACLAAGLLLAAPGAFLTAARGTSVAVVPIGGIIDGGMKNFVQRSLAEAEAMDAAAVILELDTPGGYIDAALGIRKLIDDFPLPVYAFVRNRALSAGAYLALAAEGIYMVPGSTLGAAEPRLLGIGEVDEKELSAWESEMRSVAGRRGRAPLVAAAMVRREIEIEGLVARGNLLTLTEAEATAAGYCEGIAENRLELLERLGLEGATLVEINPGLVERLAGWTTHPLVAVLLLIVGFGGMVLEIFTAGFGAAGLVSLVAFTLYFGGHIAAGHADYWVAIIFLLGVVLLVVEAFIPGFGVFGVAGLIATVTSIVLAAATVQRGLLFLAVSLVASGVFSALAFRFFARRGALRHIILSEEERAELGYVAPADQKGLLGLEGTAVTPLRPAGAAQIGEQRVDVVTEGDFIPAGAKIKVVYVEGVRVVVRRIDPADAGKAGNSAAPSK